MPAVKLLGDRRCCRPFRGRRAEAGHDGELIEAAAGRAASVRRGRLLAGCRVPPPSRSALPRRRRRRLSMPPIVSLCVVAMGEVSGPMHQTHIDRLVGLRWPSDGLLAHGGELREKDPLDCCVTPTPAILFGRRFPP
jgi:hypothetical protein